jgi:hypothetical protein
VLRLCELYRGICFRTEEKARKNFSHGRKNLCQRRKNFGQGMKNLSQGIKNPTQGRKASVRVGVTEACHIISGFKFGTNFGLCMYVCMSAGM